MIGHLHVVSVRQLSRVRILSVHVRARACKCVLAGAPTPTLVNTQLNHVHQGPCRSTRTIAVGANTEIQVVVTQELGRIEWLVGHGIGGLRAQSDPQPGPVPLLTHLILM